MAVEIPEVAVSAVPADLPDELTVLDVREEFEWQAGHIDRAVHIPLMQLPQRVDELPSDRQILVVCKVGARSGQATAFLQAKGLDVVNLAGGMLDWQAAGRTLVAERGAPPTVV